MNRRFVLGLAYREGRTALRQVGLYLSSIALGVAALVAIQGIRSDLDRAIRAEARTLLGADLQLESQLPFSPEVLEWVEEMARRPEVRQVRETVVGSMVRSTDGEARFLQLRGVGGPFPLYGALSTDPPGAWDETRRGEGAVGDPPVLAQLGAQVGDTILVGELRIPILGTAPDLPPELGFQGALGPRIYISHSLLESSGLLGFGSLVRYRILLASPDPLWAEGVVEEARGFLRQNLVSFRTASGQAEFLSESVSAFARFLGLVGILGLLLGGVGVASAIHVYVRSRLPAVAVLRCLGARQGDLTAAYLLQAGVLGAVGSLAGVLLGTTVQQLLPLAMSSWLPLELQPRLNWSGMAVGLLVGSWVALAFSVLPLLKIREVSALRALREVTGPEEEGSRSRGLRAAVAVALFMSLLALSVWQAPSAWVGVTFALGAAGVLALLWAGAWGVTRVVLWWGGGGLGFPHRLGVASLARPGNQTTAVLVALGFGTALLSAILVSERSLVGAVSLETSEGRPDLLLFDIQPDQTDGLQRLLARVGSAGALQGHPPLALIPIVPSRLESVAGRSVGELAEAERGDRPPGWVLRRVYRNTYRHELHGSEIILAGHWWNDPEAPLPMDDVPRVSLEEELARDLGVWVGDEIVWDVQGVSIPSRVISIRTVDWARFEPNFYAVFEPGVLEEAPQSFLALAAVPPGPARERLERGLAQDFPNVSLLDLGRVQEVLDGILGRLSTGIRWLAGFALAMGFLVLLASVGTSRRHRTREAALLRTLGMGGAGLRSAVGTEYLALGTLAGGLGVVLGSLGGGLLTWQFFGVPVLWPWQGLLILGAGVIVVTGGAGVLFTGRWLRYPPLAILREGTG
ncbi:MAG: FtsX-like permease family protein [Gemmatimonadota bacterium]